MLFRSHPVINCVRQWVQRHPIIACNIQVGQYLPTWRPGTDYRDSYSADASRGGGVLLDLSHEIDYVQWICGPISQLRAINRRISSLEITSDDFASVLGISAQGTIINLTMDYLSREAVRQVHIQADQATLFADLINNTVYQIDNSGIRQDFELPLVQRNYSYSLMHQAAIGGSSEVCTLQQGIAVLKTIDRIKTSSAEDWNG